MTRIKRLKASLTQFTTLRRHQRLWPANPGFWNTSLITMFAVKRMAPRVMGTQLVVPGLAPPTCRCPAAPLSG